MSAIDPLILKTNTEQNIRNETLRQDDYNANLMKVGLLSRRATKQLKNGNLTRNNKDIDKIASYVE